MKKKSNYTDRRQYDLLKKESKVDGVHNTKNFVKSERIEWLKQLYAEWLKKRHFKLNKNRKTYLTYEPDDLDIDTYW